MIETLLTPIPGDNPAGENLRYVGTYDAIQEARRADDPTLPQGVWKTELKKADWAEVEDLCRTALVEKTKDLQIAAWLTEAWIQRRGIEGAQAGFELLTGLSQTFWDHVYPLVDNGDLESRTAPFEWLNHKVSVTLLNTPITQTLGDVPNTMLDWERTLRSDGGRESASSGDDGEPAGESPRAELLARISSTPTSFYRDLSEHASAARQALEGLDEELSRRCANDAPSLGELRTALEGAQHLAARVLKERAAMAASERREEFPDAIEDDLENAMSDEDPSLPGGPIASRRDAYRYLSAAADYLTKTEPHSPAPYLVRRAIKWGRMSLAELLAELLRNNADLPTVYNLLGIQHGDSLEDEY